MFLPPRLKDTEGFTNYFVILLFIMIQDAILRFKISESWGLGGFIIKYRPIRTTKN